MRIAVKTHGCRLNQAESDSLEYALGQAGHEVIEDPREAEVVVLNSCTITHQADADARKWIRRVRRENPDAKLVVTGCWANADAAAVAAEGVDVVVGNGEKESMVALLDGAELRASGASALVSVESLSRKVRRDRPARWSLPAATNRKRSRPYLKVQDGCDYACSFCIVPSVRGRNRSMPIERAVDELEALVGEGVSEVALTGVHLGTWGRDRHEKDGLPRLVEALARVCRGADQPVRIRLGSIDPHEVSDRLIEVLGDYEDVTCGHVHLPVQAGSDAMLRRMRRGHRADDIWSLLPRLRAARPDLTIGSDVIVGHPGETEEDFEASLALFGPGGLDYAHVFPFSAREGTRAAEAEDPVPSASIARRSRLLREAVARSWAAHVDSRLATTRDALVLSRPNREGKPVALTHDYVKVVLEGAGSRPWGLRARVRLVSRDGAAVHGVLERSDPVLRSAKSMHEGVPSVLR